MLNKIKKVAYWKLYNLGTKTGQWGAACISIFVDKKDRKYWLMNANRVISSRRDHGELHEFIRVLDEERKDLWGGDDTKRKRLIADFSKCEKKYGIVAEEYLARGFSKLTDVERSRIISRMRQLHVVASLNPQEEQYRVDDKSVFIKTFAKYTGRQSLDMSRASYDAFEEVILRSSEVLIKPIDGLSGKGIDKIVCMNLDDTGRRNLYHELNGRKILLEECIQQKGILHQINPTSVNTVRIATLNDGKKVFPFFAFFRTGRAGAIVDNLHSGGIEWPVNHLTGVVSAVGFDTLGREYEAHPDSKVHVAGMTIPRWEEAVRTVCEAAKLVPELKYIGWDVVISEDGIWLIEGNCNGGFGRPYIKEYDMWSEIKAFMDETLGSNRPMKYF